MSRGACFRSTCDTGRWTRSRVRPSRPSTHRPGPSPGVVWRLWDARDRLRPHREPEIARIDLCGTVLDDIAWGGDPRTFEWFERPRDESVEAAFSLLERLGAIEGGKLTALGEQMH